MTPVVLLTGFLGSGKTTLLNRLLARRRAAIPAAAAGKLAVLVNELGAVGVDAALLPPGAARQVELPGGCICCTLDENLEASLGELLTAEPSIELVIIETTGVAEPLPILWTLGGDALAARVRVAAVVTVMDALEHERHRPLTPAVDNQVEHADVVVVSKLDALDPAARPARQAELERAVHARSPAAAIVAEPDPEAGAAALERLLADPALDLRAARALPALAPAFQAHGFESVTARIEGTLDLEELTAELEALPPTWVRLKGICWAIDRSTGSADARLIAFHRVGARVSSEPIVPLPDPPVEPRAVALGTDLDADRLAACLRKAVVPFDH
ncbi:MAG TPA: GTP-binding protein [Kofleriaceae bacterium]|nr:GTP-binding protein [Kofleriaceae bacterium]